MRPLAGSRVNRRMCPGQCIAAMCVALALLVAGCAPAVEEVRPPASPETQAPAPGTAEGMLVEEPTVQFEPSTDLAAALPLVADGAMVRLGPGVYDLDRTVRITQGITLIGAGKGVTELRSSAEGSVLEVEVEGAVTFESLTLRHVGGAVANVVVVRRGDVMVRQATIVGAVRDRSWFDDPVDARHLDGAGFGLVVLGGSTARVVASDFYANGVAGMAAFDDTELVVEDANVDANDEFGILIGGDARSTVRRTNMEANGMAGAVVEDEAEVLLVENVVGANGVDGLAFVDQAGGVASRNTIQQNSANGITIFTERNDGPVLRDNLVRWNSGAGLSILEGGRVEVVHNHIEGNLVGIVVLGYAEPDLENNVVVDHMDGGILFLGRGAGVARGNRVERNWDFGIAAGEGAHPRLAGNTVSANVGCGIVLAGQAAGEVTGNTVEGNSLEGIAVVEDARPVVTGNTLNGNAFAQTVEQPVPVSEATGLLQIPVEFVLRRPPQDLAPSWNAVDAEVKLVKWMVVGKGPNVTAFVGAENSIAVTQENVDIVLPELEARLAVYSEAIERRGFVQIAGAYDTDLTAPCDGLGLDDRTTVIEQERFTVRLANGELQDDWRLAGTVVERAVAFPHSAYTELHFSGWVIDRRVVIREPESGCRILLTPQ